MPVEFRGSKSKLNAVHSISTAQLPGSGGCFTNVLRALQDILLKFVYCRNRSSHENFMLKLCTCAQSHALGTRTKFQLEILTINVISSIVYFREIILESSRNVSETTPRCLSHAPQCRHDMATLSAILDFCKGLPSPGSCELLIFFLVISLISRWTSNRIVGDFRWRTVSEMQCVGMANRKKEVQKVGFRNVN